MSTQILIQRERLANLGPAGYRPGPAWHWSYFVEFPERHEELGSHISNQGRGLLSAESWARRFATRKYGAGNFTIVRAWTVCTSTWHKPQAQPCQWCRGTGKADSEGCNACDGRGRAS